MGISTWYASGVMGSPGRGSGPYRDDKPMSRGDKVMLALFLLSPVLGVALGLFLVWLAL